VGVAKKDGEEVGKGGGVNREPYRRVMKRQGTTYTGRSGKTENGWKIGMGENTI